MTTLSLLESGRSARLADDERVLPFLDQRTREGVRRVRQRHPQEPSAIACALEAVGRLRSTGVTLLAGADVVTLRFMEL